MAYCCTCYYNIYTHLPRTSKRVVNDPLSPKIYRSNHDKVIAIALAMLHKSVWKKETNHCSTQNLPGTKHQGTNKKTGKTEKNTWGSELQKAFQGRFTLITPPRNHDLRTAPAAPACIGAAAPRGCTAENHGFWSAIQQQMDWISGKMHFCPSIFGRSFFLIRNKHV